MKIKSILFPVDFSDRCAAVVPHVEAAARRFGAPVTLLHMVEPLVMPVWTGRSIGLPRAAARKPCG